MMTAFRPSLKALRVPQPALGEAFWCQAVNPTAQVDIKEDIAPLAVASALGIELLGLTGA